MNNGKNPIFSMATLDQSLHDVRKKLGQFPGIIAEARKQLNAEQTLLDELQIPWNEWARQIEEKEATISVALETIQKFEEHMAKVTTQKEYMAARKQVDDARRLNTQLQEEILENQQKQEEIQPRLDEVRAHYNTVMESFQAQESTILTDQRGLEKNAAECEGKIKDLADKIGERQWNHYLRLTKGNKTPAIVQVDRGTCGGCRMTIPPQSYNLLIANPADFHTCSHCARIIYYLPPEVVEEVVEEAPVKAAPKKRATAARKKKSADGDSASSPGESTPGLAAASGA